MFQRCVTTAFASTGVTVGRDPPSFVTALQASADPAASMVSVRLSSEMSLHFSSSSFLLVYLGGRRCCVTLYDGYDVFEPEF